MNDKLTAREIIEIEKNLIHALNVFERMGIKERELLYPLRELIYKIRCHAVLAKDGNLMYVDQDKELKIVSKYD